MKKLGVLFSIAVVLCCVSCGGGKPKSVKFALPYPIPPGISFKDTGLLVSENKPPIVVYWSQTVSERGYVLNRKGNIDPSPEFSHFIHSFREALEYDWEPRCNLLSKQDSGFIEWQEIPFGDFNPEEEKFYAHIGDGTFENSGPLTMLYKEGLIKPENLTVVVTDLEEQKLNNTNLSGMIRAMIFPPDNSFPRNAAAIIAQKLPFNGVNWKPDPDKIELGGMIREVINGEKPLYIIVTGKSEAVEKFVSNYKIAANKYGLISYTISTGLVGDLERLRSADYKMLDSAVMSDQSKVDRNKKILDDLWNLRNDVSGKGGAPGKIWNLKNETDNQIDYFANSKEELDFQLLKYKPIGGGAAKGHRLWQLNIGFDLPEDCEPEQFGAYIDNYRYLAAAPNPDSDDDEQAADDSKKSKKKSKSKGKKKAEPSVGVWSDTSDTILKKDLVFSEKGFAIGDDKAGLFVAPRDMKKGQLESPVVCFDFVVRVWKKYDVSLPSWVDDFNDNKNGKAPGKTLKFKDFAGMLIGLDANALPKELRIGYEYLRLPVVLVDMPTRMRGQ